MIGLLPRGPVPATLTSGPVQRTKEDIAKRIAAGQRVASSDFPSYWLAEDVRGVLFNTQFGKCAYCERRREKKYESDVEHFRPKAAVTGETDHPGYWWLAYDWSNYFYACKPCNEGRKKTQFPLLPTGIRATSPNDSLETEYPELINPMDENPEDLLCYTWQHSEGRFVKVVGTDDLGRGAKTVSVLDLNRMSLFEEDRPELLKSLFNLAKTMIIARWKNNERVMEECRQDIAYETDRQRPLLGFRRYLFRQMDLTEFVATN
ncbi:MAG: hypothetical protein QOK24_1772 [Verrucomicrobiota bacterium]|jgi:uncharacterized protein (TIGR02646 family)